MRRKMFSLIAVAAVTMLTLAGCGSNRDSSGSVTGDADDVLATAQAVGITNCAQCHTNYNAAWLEGRHANANGSPSLHYVDPSRFSCANCHNLLGDSENMPLAYPGETRRDVVSCESCHGGGQYHSGVGPIPYPRPGVEQCAQCHAELDAETGEYGDLRSRNGHSPAATTAVTGYLVSGHASDPRDRSTRSDSIGCNRCHSDEGAKLYADRNTIEDIEHTTRGALPLGEENISPIQCRTCHDTHKVGGDSLLMDATDVASAQYNTCTHCHADNEDLNYHTGHTNAAGLLDRELLDTHFDDPNTGDKFVEGYNIRVAADTACSDCHDVHSGDLTINNQWARSAHGGHILDVKEEAAAADKDVIAASVGEDTAYGWVHYPWDQTSARGTCQRCHTTTGVANHLSAMNAEGEIDPNAYDFTGAGNDFSHLADWTHATGSPQQELLYCWGCHDNAGAGTLRNAGAMTMRSTDGAAVTFDGEDVVLPDVANSNVCVACHGGAGNMDSSMSTRFVGHHAPAGGILFSEVTHMGFEFPDKNYANPAYFAHDGLGLAIKDIEDHGVVIGQEVAGSGPCATCHMSSAEGHTFSVVEKDADGVIVALTSTACIECHTGNHGAGLVVEDTTTASGLQTAAAAAAFLEAEAEGYQQAGELLGAYLGNTVLANFLNVAINNTSTDPDFIAKGLPENAPAYAFQNQKIPTEEPGGYAHNRFYVKRLLFDSIDYVMDGTLDGTINFSTLVVDYPEAAHWLGADEKTGIANRPGDPVPAE